MRAMLKRFLRSRTGLWVGRIAFFAALIAVWQALCEVGLWPRYVFPAPSDVAVSMAQGFADQTFLIGISGSLFRLGEGYLIALAIGLALGVLMAQIRPIKDTLGMLVLGLQSLPSICWLPLALLWFGLNETAILFVIVMGAVLSISQATEDGIRNTAPIYVRAARNLGATGWRLYASVVLPSALPSIVTGMKLGWSFAWRSLMAGELLYTLPGLGNLLQLGRELNDMARVIAVMLVIIALGLIGDRLLFGILERRVRERWGLL